MVFLSYTKKYAALFFLSLIITLPVMAEEERVFSLEQCIEIGLQGNIDMNIAAEDKNISITAYRGVESTKKPQIAAIAKTNYKDWTGNEKTLKMPYTDQYSMGIFAGISSSFKLVQQDYSQRLDLARKGVDLARQGEISEKDEVIFNIKKNYYEYLSALHQVEIREKMLKNSLKRKELTAILVRNGERPLIDLSMFEVNHAQIELDYKRADTNRKSVLAELLSSMGVFNYSKDSILLKDIDTVPDLAFDIDKLMELAESYSSHLKLAMINKDITRLQIDVARAKDDLDVEMTLSLGKSLNEIYNNEGDNEQENFKLKNWDNVLLFGVTARLPLYTGGAFSASVDESLSKYNKAGYSYIKTVNEVKKSIVLNFQAMEEMKSQMSISRLGIENARTNLRLAQMSYESGSGSQVQVQNAEYSLLQSELAMNNAKYQYMKSLASLSFFIGLGEDQLCLK